MGITMDTNATQMGAAAPSVEDRIANWLEAEDAPVEQAQEETPEPQAQPEPADEAHAESVEPEEKRQEAATEDAEEDVEEIELDADTLASVLGVDNDSVIVTDTGELRVRTKVDGELGEATLSEIIKNYQTSSSLTKRSMTLAEKQKAYEAESKQKLDDLNNRIAQSNVLLNAAQQNLQREYNAVDWETLRMSDPGEFAAKRQQFDEANRQLQAVMQNTRQQAEDVEKQQREQFNQAYQNHLANEREAIINRIPEFSTQENWDKGREQLAKYIESQNIDMQNPWKRDMVTAIVSNAEGLDMARKAMLWDQAQTQTKVAEKKVQKLPKIVKPGASKTKAQKQQASRETDIRDFRKRVKTMRGQDSTDLLAQMINKHIL